MWSIVFGSTIPCLTLARGCLACLPVCVTSPHDPPQSCCLWFVSASTGFQRGTKWNFHMEIATVDLINNYDTSHLWPVALPRQFPSCLLGAFGFRVSVPSCSAALIKGPCCLDRGDYSGYSLLPAGQLFWLLFFLAGISLFAWFLFHLSLSLIFGPLSMVHVSSVMRSWKSSERCLNKCHQLPAVYISGCCHCL